LRISKKPAQQFHVNFHTRQKFTFHIERIWSEFERTEEFNKIAPRIEKMGEGIYSNLSKILGG